MIFLDKLRASEDYGRVIDKLTEGATVVRVHRDVSKLATELASQDDEKLAKAGALLFAPAFDTWLDIDLGDGNIGFYFHGAGGVSITHGDAILVMQKHTDATPVMIPCSLDIPSARLRLGLDPSSRKRLPFQTDVGIDPILGNQLLNNMMPLLLAILALINSPKIVKKDYVDQAKINKKRSAVGKYTFHPHHAVRLNVDQKSIRTTGGRGIGASKALHMVRAHLRLVRDHYVLVTPHWRGDPAIGMIRTTYEADRRTSRWKD